jgi:hypothetical protein
MNSVLKQYMMMPTMDLYLQTLRTFECMLFTIFENRQADKAFTRCISKYLCKIIYKVIINIKLKLFLYSIKDMICLIFFF